MHPAWDHVIQISPLATRVPRTPTPCAQPASAEKLSTPDPKDHSTYNAADNVMPHPGLRATASSPEAGGKDKSYWLMQPIYSKEYVESVEPHHQVPKAFFEKAGYYGVQAMRSLFDVATGYGHQMTEERWLRRILFLETVAGTRHGVMGWDNDAAHAWPAHPEAREHSRAAPLQAFQASSQACCATCAPCAP